MSATVVPSRIAKIAAWAIVYLVSLFTVGLVPIPVSDRSHSRGVEILPVYSVFRQERGSSTRKKCGMGEFGLLESDGHTSADICDPARGEVIG